MNNTQSTFLEESFRWYGPTDPVPLAYIRQAGATALFTSLHQIPYGELWPREAIRERKAAVEAAGLKWTAVESVPVHEDIKTGRGDLKTLFRNYRETLGHLAAEGISTVVYNFMPVLDWIRTDLRYVLPDGSECLRFDPSQFAAFELFALQRPGAEADYTAEQLERGARWWRGLDEDARAAFVQNVIDVFPGCKMGLTLEGMRAMLARYSHLNNDGLVHNLARFHEAVIPTAEAVGVRLAIHPDDPPFSVLGLPRIVSTAADVQALLQRVDSPANGLCFCTGSFSARPANDLVAMVKQFAPRIHAVHLRSTQRLPDGSFYEADHLAGSVDMAAVVRALLDEQDRRRAEGRADWRLPFRPDHGHTMMDDLAKPAPANPGYSCIGRARGLAELRGLMHGLRHAERAGRPALPPAQAHPHSTHMRPEKQLHHTRPLPSVAGRVERAAL
ncbi:MAG: mannonate dehydratase [Opitutaceae bacterium]|nr:mannonate dehydratase [Opitutaceae bacterium]